MRVLVAPDKFAGTLSATAAAEAIIAGWRRWAPDDQLLAAPMADGGPGFCDAIVGATSGRTLEVPVRGPLGESVLVAIVIDDDTAYIESAQACGLHISAQKRPLEASTFGVGQAICAAVETGVSRVIVGLGGSSTVDGGAGMLAALGATAASPLNLGPIRLESIGAVDIDAARSKLAGIELIVAADVNVPLLGMFGATKTFGPQKGLTDAEILRVDRILDGFVDAVCGTRPGQRRIADAPGAGAAGGLGFALLALGARIESGIGIVAAATGVATHLPEVDLVITGEGAFDYSSRAGKVVHGVAQLAAETARPCIVLAGRVDIGSREMRAIGVESAYAMTDWVTPEESIAFAYQHLADLAQRVARTWSRPVQ